MNTTIINRIIIRFRILSALYSYHTISLPIIGLLHLFIITNIPLATVTVIDGISYGEQHNMKK